MAAHSVKQGRKWHKHLNCLQFLLAGYVIFFFLIDLKGGVHGSAHVHESKYFFAFARYDPSLFNLIRYLWIIRKGIGNSGGNIFIWMRYFACK